MGIYRHPPAPFLGGHQPLAPRRHTPGSVDEPPKGLRVWLLGILRAWDPIPALPQRATDGAWLGLPPPTPLVTGIRRLRRSPVLTEGQLWQFLERFQLEIQAGVGLQSGQGTDPQLMLRVSRNSGKTWSPEKWVSAGKIGQYWRRAIWRRLGRGRNVVFEVSSTDPVFIALFDASLERTLGSS